MQQPRRNIEIKLRLSDDARLDSLQLQEIGAQDRGVLLQEDVFFHAHRGRLKLRFEPPRRAQLIAYVRDDEAALRASDYRIVECDDGNALRRLLAESLGEIGTVRKRRHLHLLENIRLHLDEVEELGHFLEIEAVVDAAHGEAACTEAARRLLQRLGPSRARVESRAYIDLLLEARR